jgi:hypothetical protein
MLIAGGTVAALAGVASLGVQTLSSRAHASVPGQPRVEAVVASTGSEQPPAAELPADPPIARPAAKALAVVQQGSPAPLAMPRAIVALGRTELQDSVYVERTADSVVVHFDTPLTRTRRRDKFEQLVRTTLPAVYGATADSLLAHVAEGRLLPDADLLVELPLRGVALPPRDGWALTLWPETRPGRDGPLVVAYHVTAIRTR